MKKIISIVLEGTHVHQFMTRLHQFYAGGDFSLSISDFKEPRPLPDLITSARKTVGRRAGRREPITAYDTIQALGKVTRPRSGAAAVEASR